MKLFRYNFVYSHHRIFIYFNKSWPYVFYFFVRCCCRTGNFCLIKFFIASIFHSGCTCGFQLIHRSACISFLWPHVSFDLFTITPRTINCLSFHNSKVNWTFRWKELVCVSWMYLFQLRRQDVSSGITCSSHDVINLFVDDGSSKNSNATPRFWMWILSFNMKWTSFVPRYPSSL